jgi:hypothetical protein
MLAPFGNVTDQSERLVWLGAVEHVTSLRVCYRGGREEKQMKGAAFVGGGIPARAAVLELIA